MIFPFRNAPQVNPRKYINFMDTPYLIYCDTLEALSLFL